MKCRTLLSLAALVLTIPSMMAIDYTGQLTVAINGETSTQSTTMSVTKSGDKYNLTLNNFVLKDEDSSIPVGNIALTDLAAGTTSTGITTLATNQKILITAGDDSKYSADEWMGPLLGEVPINMVARFDYAEDGNMVTTIDIDMQATLGQTIAVTFSNLDDSYMQLPNSGMEEWVESSNEPVRWHGFASATGKYASTSKSNIKLTKSTNVHAGSKGIYSAVMTAAKILFVVANGSMTSGQFKAGSMTATDTDNHAEMDITSTNVDNNGDKFYMELPAKPDSIKVWMKSYIQNTSHKASMNAVIFDGSYYQDPEVSGTTYSNVAAKATNTVIYTDNKWVQQSLPFDYDSYASNNADCNAILVTFSTNATPGQGTKGDSLYVDDIELVYDAAFDSITWGVRKLDFTKGVDTIYLAGAQLSDFNPDEFTVTTIGKGAMLTKTMEETDFGCRVIFTVVSADLKKASSFIYNVFMGTSLNVIVNNAEDGEQYTIADPLYACWHGADNDYTYISAVSAFVGFDIEDYDLENWIFIKVPKSLNVKFPSDFNYINGWAFKGTTETMSTAPTFVVDTIFLSDIASNDADLDVASYIKSCNLASAISYKPSQLVNFTGWVDGNGKLRAYRVAPQGQSLDMDLTLLNSLNGTTTVPEKGTQVTVQSIVTLYEPWDDTDSAPRRIAKDDEGYFNNYLIKPVSYVVNDMTGITDVEASDATIVGRTYYNAAGQALTEPQQGFNIVVIRYSNGETTVNKEIK